MILFSTRDIFSNYAYIILIQPITVAFQLIYVCYLIFFVYLLNEQTKKVEMFVV